MDDEKTVPTDPKLTFPEVQLHLGNLNWLLRRIGKSISVEVDTDTQIIKDVTIAPANWTVTCDKCSTEYNCGTEMNPKCPNCGNIEV